MRIWENCRGFCVDPLTKANLERFGRSHPTIRGTIPLRPVHRTCAHRRFRRRRRRPRANLRTHRRRPRAPPALCDTIGAASRPCHEPRKRNVSSATVAALRRTRRATTPMPTDSPLAGAAGSCRGLHDRRQSMPRTARIYENNLRVVRRDTTCPAGTDARHSTAGDLQRRDRSLSCDQSVPPDVASPCRHYEVLRVRVGLHCQLGRIERDH